MGSSRYSHDDYEARSSYRSSTGTKAFAYDDAIKTGKAKAKVHPSLDPKGVKIRESRDSKGQNALPIGVMLDLTGSMGQVPITIQKKLPKLMGGFLDDKASGKKYIGDYVPAICIGGVDDYRAMSGYGHEGTLQIGQFESGLEIDDNLTNLWITGNGGGTYEESYQLALYFYARHTAHDNWEKRHRKGYLFIIGDEHAYGKVLRQEVKDIIGDDIEADIPLETILKEVQKHYHVFFILPNMTTYYNDGDLHEYWQKLVGKNNFLRLEDPEKVCELIVGAVAICEATVGLADVGRDLGIDTGALVPLSKSGVSQYSAEGLAPAAAAGVDRL